ncbi:head GIN domain-containing protein [Sphingomonas quercus]|uniref:DUF2807 domain-containing protein n=1 Tax=Sphingomonas quercus TaxID=2842451 RepID=A0ABS6BI96_9SPHN|nr:head GIN domain-containing protein [Sphingomonas quercus]MBU3078031.1 DUF2807 domain-containing protein [Sphingomonas quercus]
MRSLIFFAVAAAAAATPALSAERSFNVAGFDRVRSTGPFDVQVRVGGGFAVRASGPQEVLDRLEIVNEGGQLVIRTDRRDGSNWRGWFGRGERTLVTVSLPALNGVALTGSGNVSVDHSRGRVFAASLAGSGDLTLGSLQAENASLELTGSGNLTVAGNVGAAKASARGSGDIRAGALRADTAAVALVGSGNIELAAQRSAAVTLNGSGDVTISGPARCNIAKHGSGAVRCRG